MKLAAKVLCRAAPLLFMAGSAATADELARCATIDAADARLACYDKLAHRSASATAPGTTPLAPAASVPSSVAPTTALPTVTGSAAAAMAADPKNFGLTPAQQHITELGPKSIAARIAYLNSDKLGHTNVVLDSGQIWTVLDNDGRLSPGDAVTIKHAAVGSFLLWTPANHSYRVRRIQ